MRRRMGRMLPGEKSFRVWKAPPLVVVSERQRRMLPRKTPLRPFDARLAFGVIEARNECTSRPYPARGAQGAAPDSSMTNISFRCRTANSCTVRYLAFAARRTRLLTARADKEATNQIRCVPAHNLKDACFYVSPRHRFVDAT
eukprot:3039914-Rhodomonas_salina.1